MKTIVLDGEVKPGHGERGTPGYLFVAFKGCGPFVQHADDLVGAGLCLAPGAKRAIHHDISKPRVQPSSCTASMS